MADIARTHADTPADKAHDPSASLAAESLRVAQAQSERSRGAGSGNRREETYSTNGKYNDASSLAHSQSGIDPINRSELLHDRNAIKATQDFVLSDAANTNDKAAALRQLHEGGVRSFVGKDGANYSIAETRSLTKGTQLELLRQGSDGVRTKVLDTGTATQNDRAADEPGRAARALQGQRDGAPAADRPTNPLFDPKLSAEEKLKAARDMAQHGERRVTGPDGKQYDIALQKHGHRSEVAIFTRDQQGKSYAALRGIVDDEGHVSQQRDRHGREVGLQSDHGRQHDGDNPIFRRESTDHQREERQEGQRTDEQRLTEARERLRRDANEQIRNQPDRERFLQNMQRFEQRAQEQQMAPREVTETYQQMSRLLEARVGRVPAEQRSLAAQTFMHHAADPTNIDQGYHNTCNVTTLQEHTMTRTPSRAAEMMATTALDGQWRAPDGRVINIDQRSLVPGAEERNNPPADNHRSYATQILNLTMVNDITQRRIPPMYYSQERPTSRVQEGSLGGRGDAADTGERLRYGNGSDVTRTNSNGRTEPVNGPAVSCGDMSDFQQRLNGDSRFLIVNDGLSDRNPGLVRVQSAEQLASHLREMQQERRLPAVVMVDVNDPAFGGDDNPRNVGRWHVVSVTGFDPATGMARISNQWGSARDTQMHINDLYRTTVSRPRTPGAN